MDVDAPTQTAPRAPARSEPAAHEGTLRRSAAWLRAQDERRVGLVALLLAMAGSAALILWLERGTTYMSDEWGWINYAGGGSLADMFKPLNQHLSVLVLLLTRLGLDVWGTADAFLPFKLMEVAGVLALGALVYAFARPRVGPLVALAPAMIPMYLGTATVILLQPLIGLQVLYSIAFGVGAMVALDRKSLAGDVAACVLVVLSLASFSIGIAFLAGVAVSVLLSPDRLRRAYVFLIPALLYGAWRIWANKYGSGGGPELANVPAVPFYYTDSIATNVTSLFGLSPLIGPGPGTSLFLEGFRFEAAAISFVYTAFEVSFVVFVARRLQPYRPISPTFWGALTVLLVLWTIQGLVLVAGRTPGEARYIYPGVIALSLVVVEALRNVRFRPLAVATILALTAVGIVGNLPRFSYGRDLIVYLAPRTLAYTGLMDMVGKHADPEYVPSTDTPFAAPAGALSIPVFAYQEISARTGPLGDPPAKILELDEGIRNDSDEVLVRMLQLRLAAAPGGVRGRCTAVARAAARGGVRLPAGGAVLRAESATPLLLRRFGPDSEVEVGRLEAGRPARLRIPADAETNRIPWIAETPKPAGLSICPLPARI